MEGRYGDRWMSRTFVDMLRYPGTWKKMYIGPSYRKVVILELYIEVFTW